MQKRYPNKTSSVYLKGKKYNILAYKQVFFII